MQGNAPKTPRCAQPAPIPGADFRNSDRVSLTCQRGPALARRANPVRTTKRARDAITVLSVLGPPAASWAGGFGVSLPVGSDITPGLAASFDAAPDRAVHADRRNLSLTPVVRPDAPPPPDVHPGPISSCPPAAGRVLRFRARRPLLPAAGSRTGHPRRVT